MLQKECGRKSIGIRKKGKLLGILDRAPSRPEIYERTLSVGECWSGTTSHTKCLFSVYDLRPASHEFRITRLSVISQRFLKVTLREPRSALLATPRFRLSQVKSTMQLPFVRFQVTFSSYNFINIQCQFVIN